LFLGVVAAPFAGGGGNGPGAANGTHHIVGVLELRGDLGQLFPAELYLGEGFVMIMRVWL
jgi:hypothetical protein